MFLSKAAVVFVRSVLGYLLCATATLSHAATLPAKSDLPGLLGHPPITVEVIEPHLSTRDRLIKVDYVGYLADEVLAVLFGARWKEERGEMEFHALDGYVSRIPVERFKKYRAYLVFERRGQNEFMVDNIAQNEKRVPLGPYYLVWDNIAAPELVADGGSYWPYQVTTVMLSTPATAALLPGELMQSYGDHAALAKKYCLSCHQINGYGGEKMPSNLASSVKSITEDSFRRWVLSPNEVKPGTTMPALPVTMPEAQRQAIARKLYDYLQAVPVTH